MNRHDFIKRTLCVGLCTGSCLLHAENLSAGITRSVQEDHDNTEAFREEWLRALFQNLDDLFSEEERISLMEACGRDCARRGATQIAEKCKGDLPGLVGSLKKILGEEGARMEGDKVFITYSKCYCPVVASIEGRISETYCHCSRGWLKEMFEIVTSHQAEVQILQTVKSGADSCRFLIII